MPKRTCEIERCVASHYAHGFCKRHYDKNRRRGDALAPDPERISRDGPCVTAGCGRPRRSRGLCEACYCRWRHYGDDALTLADQHDGRCDACGTTEPGGRWSTFHIDHDHRTGAVRGMLCQTCNGALGLVNDDVDRLRALAAYIEASRLPASAWAASGPTG